jgi:hypothetical protein
MITKEENRPNYLSTALIVLLLLFVGVISKNIENPVSNLKQYEFATVIHTGVSAIISSQTDIIQKSITPVINKLSVKFFKEEFKLISFDKLINHKFILLLKSGLKIEPLFLHQIYYLHYYTNTEESPVLS